VLEKHTSANRITFAPNKSNNFVTLYFEQFFRRLTMTLEQYEQEKRVIEAQIAELRAQLATAEE